MTTVLLTCLLLLGSPERGDPDKSETPTIVTTLQMDPEKPRPIVGWWRGPSELIELAVDGRYRRWNDVDRFRRPVEIGRWHRENHAVFWLESYAVPKTPRRRVSLWLEDDKLMADLTRNDRGVGGAGDPITLRFHRTPPACAADAFLGSWIGPGGELELLEDLTYRWKAPPSDGPAGLGGQRGVWSLEDGGLVLEPLPARDVPVLTDIDRDEQGVVIGIRSIHGSMTRPPKPAKVPVNPEDRPVEMRDDEAGI